MQLHHTYFKLQAVRINEDSPKNRPWQIRDSYTLRHLAGYDCSWDLKPTCAISCTAIFLLLPIQRRPRELPPAAMPRAASIVRPGAITSSAGPKAVTGTAGEAAGSAGGYSGAAATIAATVTVAGAGPAASAREPRAAPPTTVVEGPADARFSPHPVVGSLGQARPFSIIGGCKNGGYVAHLRRGISVRCCDMARSTEESKNTKEHALVL